MMPPTPSIRSLPECFWMARCENATSSSNGRARRSRLLATSGESGAAYRQGEMRSISSTVTGLPSALSSIPASLPSASDTSKPVVTGLSASTGSPAVRPMAQQTGGDECLADVGAGRSNEERAHRPGNMRSRNTAARREMSSPLCSAENVSRSRAVPSGTVGGRIATTRKPSFSNNRDASSASSASPMTMGTMALCASGRLVALREHPSLGERKG